MNQIPIEPILNQLKLDPLDQVYFNASWMEKVLFHKETNRADLTLHLKSALPYSVYRTFKTRLIDTLKMDVTLKMVCEEVGLELKDVNSYVQESIQELNLTTLLKHNLTVMDGDTLYFLNSGEKISLKAEQELKKLENHLKLFGLTMSCAYKLKVLEDVVVESKTPEVGPNENTFNQTTVKYKKLKLDDYEPTPLKACVVGLRNVKVRGKIFSIESQWVRNNTVLRQSVFFNDEEDALSFSHFLDQEDKLKKYGMLKEGDCLEIYGDIIYDTFSKDLQIAYKDMKLIPDWMNRKDDSDLKRIEFHLHTNMSEMDGVSPIEAYVRQAFAWGHEGLALTDHFSVQAFPKAQKAVENLLRQNPERSFKMIYGCEFNLVDAHLNIVRNPQGQDIKNATYVVFDLETTGLSSRYDSIIEFGAVKIKQGMIIDRIQMFVNPKQTLSSFIIEKTNITQTQVDQAKTDTELLDHWMRFFSDSILVAHNADFDIGFINACLLRHGRPMLSNTVIDTLDLAKALLKDKRYYRLGSLAKNYKVSYDENVAHRADYDAEILVQVFLKMLNCEESKPLLVVDELNALAGADGYRKQIKKHVNILAKNSAGLKSLYKLVTLTHTQRLVSSGKDTEGLSETRLLRSDIDACRKDLFIGSSCFNGEVFDLAATRSQTELEAAMRYYDYIEVQPPENYRPMIENHVVKDENRLKEILTNIIQTAIALKIPVIATGDVHYLSVHDKKFRDVYIQAKGVGAGRHPLYHYNENKRRQTLSPEQHFRTTQEMLDAFDFLDFEMAQRIVILNPKYLFNQIESVNPIKRDLFTPTIDGADERLKLEVYKNAGKRYGNPLPDLVQKRLMKELDSITTHGFGVIYYIAHLLVQKSLDDGYMVGSRGSVGSSLVATMANITEVNPLPPHYVCPKCQTSEFITDGSVDSGFDMPDKNCPHCGSLMDVDGHDIPFETFLGFEGDKVPDIDLNFSGDYQDKAHAYTKVLFGEEHVFRAGTISTVAQRTAYGYVKGYLEEMGLEQSFRPAYMLYMAKGCEGVKRTTGQHPGGIIVIPQDMDVHDFTPVQYPANKSHSEWLTTHFEFGDIHDNVLKLDILGHVDPTAMKFLERLSGIDVRSIRMNDATAIEVFSSTKSLKLLNPNYSDKTAAVGLPEFGTGFVRGILESTQPKNFSDLVRVSGLSHGTDVWLNNARNLIDQGYPFSEVIGCRDDIMIYLIHKGLPAKSAFDIMESVRKGRGLKDEWKKLMAEHDVPEWYIQSCLKIKYMFPKAHAVAYVLMAVRVAWFKVHHPSIFYASFFSLRATAFEYETMLLGHQKIYERLRDIQSRLNDSKRKSTVTNKEEELIPTLEVAYEMTSRGLTFGPLNLNTSLANEYLIDPNHPNTLIPPFTILDGLGANVANSIIEARSKGPFMSKEDLQTRTLINNTQLKKFETYGLLNNLDDQNQMSLF